MQLHQQHAHYRDYRMPLAWKGSGLLGFLVPLGAALAFHLETRALTPPRDGASGQSTGRTGKVCERPHSTASAGLTPRRCRVGDSAGTLVDGDATLGEGESRAATRGEGVAVVSCRRTGESALASARLVAANAERRAASSRSSAALSRLSRSASGSKEDRRSTAASSCLGEKLAFCSTVVSVRWRTTDGEASMSVFCARGGPTGRRPFDYNYVPT